MTIPATESEISYAGDGVTLAFDIPFPFDTASDLKVISTDADGNPTELTSGFSVSGGNGSTGTLTFLVAPSASVDITILDDVELTQTHDYTDNDPFPAESHETALDRGVRISKRLYQLIRRSIRTRDGDPITDMELGSVDNRKGKYLFFNAVTGAIEYAVNLVTTALSQSIIAQLLNPQAAAEIAAGVVPTNYAYPATSPVDIRRYGGVMDASTSGVRTDNSAALVAALTVTDSVFIPAGTFWIDPNTTLSDMWNIVGSGSANTTIKGDGDLFSVTTADNGEMRRFSHMTIANDTTRGKLFKYVSAVDTNRVEFDHVNFGKANYHVHVSGGGNAVSWKFSDCRAIDAAVECFHFEGLWASSWRDCYVWYSAIGLRCTNGNVSTNSILGGAWEQMDDSAIVLDASNASYEVADFLISTHFEANGKTGSHNADVQLLTSAATRLRSVKLLNCGFFTPTATQTFRVTVAAGGGGNIDFVEIDGGACMGVVPLCTDSTSIKVRNVYYQSVSPKDTNVVPVQVQYQDSLKFLGSRRIIGAEGGSGVVQALVTPPSGTRSADIIVEGNIYNGVANSHIGLLEARYSASNGNVRATVNVDHSSGSNQGFAASWTGTQIQVANKAAMTNNQSGDTLIRFWG